MTLEEIFHPAVINCYNADSCLIDGGKYMVNPTEITDTEAYFFRGFAGSDCLLYLIELGIINE